MKVGDEVYLREDSELNDGCTAMNQGHPNAAILMEIAKEAAINPEYWKEFEVATYETTIWSIPASMFHLYQCLCDGTDVRRKPRTIRIGNYDVPEPIRKKPNYEDEIWLVSVDDGSVHCVGWKGVHLDYRTLSYGLYQETREGAELMLKALQELLNGEKNDLSDDSYNGIHY